MIDGREVKLAAGTVPPLKSFEKTTVELTCGKRFKAGVSYDFKVIINPDAPKPVTLQGKTTPTKSSKISNRPSPGKPRAST